MTEDQIERMVEKMVDRADALFMSGRLTQAQYDARMAEIAQWADNQRTPDITTMDAAKVFSQACHGVGAEPRLVARAELDRRAEAAGMDTGMFLTRLGFDLAAYFASRPIA
jgi:hypothetical protein